MLGAFIPNYEDEIARLRSWGPQGFILGFNLTLRGPEHLHMGYDPEWQRIYEESNLHYTDPVFVWITGHEGYIRWSEIDLPDVHGVMVKAQKYNLRYGAAFSRLAYYKRSFLSIARSDRELTDTELEVINAKFESWVEMVIGSASLSPGELEVLRSLRDGLGQREIANQLQIAESTVKQRSIKACRKLGAKNRIQAVAMAVARNYV